MTTIEMLAQIIKMGAEADDLQSLLINLSSKSTDFETIREAVALLQGRMPGEAADIAASISANFNNLVDCSGTGGSGLHHFNTSTAVAFVLAAAGLSVAKFGNRAATSNCGSFDLLSLVGYPANLPLSRLPDLLSQTRLAFLFAPSFYPCLANVAQARRKLKQRTIFNFIGPLLNPVNIRYRLMGVSSEAILAPVARAVSHNKFTEAALVATSDRGLDEIDCIGATTIVETRASRLVIDRVDASLLLSVRGLNSALFSAVDDLQTGFEADGNSLTREVASSQRSFRTMQQAGAVYAPNHSDTTFDAQPRPTAPVDIYENFVSTLSGTGSDTTALKLVVLNAGAALYIAGKSARIQDGCKLAFELIQEGRVREHFELCRRIYERLSR